MPIKQYLGLAGVVLMTVIPMSADGQGTRPSRSVGQATPVAVGSDDAVPEKIYSKDFVAAANAGDVALLRRMLAGTTTTVGTPEARPTYCRPPLIWTWGLTRVIAPDGTRRWEMQLMCVYPLQSESMDTHPHQ